MHIVITNSSDVKNLESVCRHKGVLQVWVLEAKDLHKQDIGGKADPFVQLQTRVQDLEKTVRLTASCMLWCTRCASQTCLVEAHSCMHMSYICLWRHDVVIHHT